MRIEVEGVSRHWENDGSLGARWAEMCEAEEEPG